MANANQSDFLGEGVNAGVKKPNDPNDLPNPKNPGGISNNQLAKVRQLNAASSAQGANLAAMGRQNVLNSGQKQVAAAPGKWGTSSTTASRGTTANAKNDVWGDIKDIWTKDPVTTAVLAAPYAVGAAGALIPAAAGGVGGASAIPGTAATTGAAQSAAAAQAAAAAAHPAAAAAGSAAAAGAAGAAGGITARQIAQGVLGGVGLVGTAANVFGGGGGSSGGGGAAPAVPGGRTTNYAPSGGYAQPTVSAPTNNSAAVRQTVAQANQFAAQNTAATQGYAQQSSAAANRAAPQITAPSSAQQQSVYNAAGSFQPNTSGVAGIRAATADVSGAGRLENYQTDTQGISNLEGFQSTNSQQGVNALYGFRPDETFRSANQLENFQATNTAEGASAVAGFRPDQVQQDAEDLRRFRADQSGINRLNAYADEAQGPSAAQAMLRSQSDADKRTMLAISRSGRGGPGAAVNAQRQAMTEGGLIAAETRGQGAALAAQEFEAYKGRQLQALAQAGSLISQSEAQRLQGLSQAGALMSAADAQKLSALQAYGQLKATQDSQQLSAKQSAGQLNANAENMLLGATSNAAQLQGQMDAQHLSALSSASQARSQADVIKSNNLQSAAGIRLQGSAINQQGQIAATQAELAGSAQQLQAMGLQAQIASDIRSQDIGVLKSNLDASLQQMNLNDTQVRYFAGLGQQRDLASQSLQQQAGQFGISADQAQQALNLQYQQALYSQLTQQQQLEYNYASLNSNNALGASSQAIQIAGQQQQQNQFDVNQANQKSLENRRFYSDILLRASQL